MKRIVLMVGMWMLGLASLSAVALLFELRTGRALADAPMARARPSLRALAAGARHSLEHGADALDHGPRSEATHALDAAMRALEAGAYNDHSAFGAARDGVKEARTLLQRGRLEGAVDRARAAARELRALEDGWPEPPAAALLSAYEGATVVDLQGIRIGEVAAVRADEGILEIQVEGALDVFGVLDLAAAAAAWVPADVLLFGEQRTLGATLVVLPVFAIAADEAARL